MKNWFLLLFLLAACSDVKAPVASEHIKFTIPEVLVVGEIHEPAPTLSREELLKPVFDTIEIMMGEQEPFDEPKHEVGQQDGSLRPRWEQAYFKKQGSYFFNDDKYYVYGKGKAPRPPEVCPDFIEDILERAAGTWYQDNKRVVGKLDIRSNMKEMGLDPRRVNDLVAYFKSQPDDYQFVWAVDDPSFAPTNYWGGPTVTPVNGTGGLKEFLKEYRVQVGDIIIISGKAPWDHGAEEHHHSMFVTGLDSAGMVQYITGNDAWVREKEIGLEMARAPKRKLKYIVRLTDQFLTEIR